MYNIEYEMSQLLNELLKQGQEAVRLGLSFLIAPLLLQCLFLEELQ